ncbi:MAG: hypothetical protein ACM3SU_11205 [Acidobacteriota bacterium]
MKRPLTRRAVTKILLASPVALAGGPLACQSLSGPAPQRLSPEEQKKRQEAARAADRLSSAAERLRQMEIPIGSEPAVHFTPLLAKK